MIDMKATIVRNSEILASDMDGETVMMHMGKGKYYNLGRTGGFIWNMIEEPIAIEDLIQGLTDAFHVTKDQCEKDTLPFIEKLKSDGLIEVI